MTKQQKMEKRIARFAKELEEYQEFGGGRCRQDIRRDLARAQYDLECYLEDLEEDKDGKVRY